VVDDGRDTGLDADNIEDGHVDVVAVVLGQVDAQRRAQMATHIVQCPACRSEYDDMAATVRELLPAVPAVQPPLGFDQQVLARMGLSQPERRNRPRMGWLAGAAAALILAVVAVSWWTTTDRTEQRSIGSVSALERADGGGHVGTVSVGDVDGETVMVVALVSAPEGVSYRCLTTFSDGTTAESDPWPSGYGAWIVPLPQSGTRQVDSVELLVDGTDHVWSTASFEL
jgi:hypothetical protein